MTYNDIVDMENDIIDEIGELLLNEFEELEDKARKRQKNNNSQFLSDKEKTKEQEQNDVYIKEVDEENKVGYVLKLFPSQKVGRVEQIKITKSGLRKLVLKMNDGSIREEYDNDLLYEVIRKEERIKESVKEEKHCACKMQLASQTQKNSDDNAEQEKVSVKREALVGDTILYDSKRCNVIGKKTTACIMKLIIQYEDGTLDNVPNDWSRYTVMTNENDGEYFSNAESIKQMGYSNKIRKKASVGDWILRASDYQAGKVVDIKKLGSGLEKLILELEDGSQSALFNRTKLYWVLI